MAKTFYKYGERDAISYVDWSQIGKNFSTMVDTELTRREDEKAAIQKGVDETMAFINDNPVGEYEVANDFSLFHSQNAQEYLVMADKMLKSGQISPQDFVRMRENLNTGTKGIYEVADSYQKRFKEVMDDVNSGDPKLSNIVYEQMISLEGVGKLSNTDAIIDTSSGRVNLSKYDVDENGVKRYTEAYSTGELKAFLQSDIQRFDVKGAVSDIVSNMGTLKEAYFEEAKRYGGMNILTKKLNMQGDSELEGVKESYQNWRDDSIDSYMSDINRASIIVDFLQGQGYKATTSKKAFDEDKTGKLLYVDPNNKAYLTDEQDSLARKTFATQLDNAINREYLESGAGSKPYGPTGGGTGLDSGKVMNMMGLLYYGNQSQVDTATDYFRDVIPNATEVDRQKDKLVVTFKDGTSRDFDLTGRTQKEFIESATPLLAGEVDLSDALSSARFDPNQTKSDFMSLSKVNAKLKSSEVARQYIGVALTDTPRERGELTRTINSLFGTLGFKATPIRFNQLTVTPPVGESVKFSNTDIQGIKNFLSTNIVDENADASLEYMKGYIEDVGGVEVTEEVIDTSGY